MPINASSLDDAWGQIEDSEGTKVFANTSNRENIPEKVSAKEELTQGNDVNVRGSRSQIARQQPSASHFMMEQSRLGNNVVKSSTIDELYSSEMPTYYQQAPGNYNKSSNYYSEQMSMMPHMQQIQIPTWQNKQVVQGLTHDPPAVQNNVHYQNFYDTNQESYAHAGDDADIELIDKETLQKDLNNLKVLSEQTHQYFEELKNAIAALSTTQSSEVQEILEKQQDIQMNNTTTSGPVDTKDKPWLIACMAVIIVLLVVIVFIGGYQLYKFHSMMNMITAML